MFLCWYITLQLGEGIIDKKSNLKEKRPKTRCTGEKWKCLIAAGKRQQLATEHDHITRGTQASNNGTSMVEDEDTGLATHHSMLPFTYHIEYVVHERDSLWSFHLLQGGRGCHFKCRSRGLLGYFLIIFTVDVTRGCRCWGSWRGRWGVSCFTLANKRRVCPQVNYLL